MKFDAYLDCRDGTALVATVLPFMPAVGMAITLPDPDRTYRVLSVSAVRKRNSSAWQVLCAVEPVETPDVEE